MGNASSAAPSVKPVAETSSSCLTQGITAAHNFEVINFSLLEGMGVGEYVRSRNFRVGGFDWNISLYPDGITAEYKHHVSAFLAPQGQGVGEEGVRARFTFTVLGKDGKMWDANNMEHTFKSPLRGFGWGTFIYKSWHFRRMLRNNNDRFTVRCVLTVIQDPHVEDVCAIVIPEPSVLQDLASMLSDGDGADVTFVVGGRSFPAHRCVLAARSAVFRAELFGPMQEKAARSVRVDDMEPSIFEALLHFVYTDSLPDDDCDGKDRNVPMQHLLVAADRYGLDRLRLMCEVRMCRSIDADTVATTLALAEQHRCVQLKNACLGFIASRGVLGAVVQTSGFCHLVESCPLVLLEILDKLASLGI
jgi:speckle-type POZ protein